MSFSNSNPYGIEFGSGFWPELKAKGPNVKWPKLPGNPRTGGKYPKALENGRMLEQSLGDALNELIQVKKDMMDKVKLQTMDITDNTVCKQGDKSRPAALAIRNIAVLKEIKKFLEDVANLIQAIQQATTLILQLQNNVRGMIQANLNALTNLLKEMCNWNLPDLPAIPNMLGLFQDFQGFNFGLYFNQFKQNNHTPFTFDFNMKKDCKIRVPNLDIFRNYPKGFQIKTLSGQNVFYIPEVDNPTYDGKVWDLQNLTQAMMEELRSTKNTPIMEHTFNRREDTVGGFPKPEKIISNYTLPPTEAKRLLPAFVIPQVYPYPSDPDFKTFQDWQVVEDILRDMGVNISGVSNGHDVTLIPTLVKDAVVNHITNYQTQLSRRILLQPLEESGFIPNEVALWVSWLGVNRENRGGIWTPENEDNFKRYIQPSLDFLDNNQALYNNLLGEGVNLGYSSLPLADTLKNLPLQDRNTLLWRLSYVEAGLLGTPRSTKWDKSAIDTTYVADWVRTPPSLSYQTHEVKTPVTTIKFKVDANYTEVFTQILQYGKEVIEKHANWRSQKFQYTYDALANVIETDRFTQFWKTVEGSYKQLLAEHGDTLAYILSDWRLAAAVLIPTANKDRYDYFMEDFELRNQSWIGKTPSVYPITTTPIQDDVTTPSSTAGWSGAAFDPNVLKPTPIFDPVVFLTRPDVQACKLPEQLAMLELNAAYAETTAAMMGQLLVLDEALYTAIAQGNSIGEFVGELSATLKDLEALSASRTNPDEKLSPEEAAMFKDLIAYCGTAGPGSTSGQSSEGSNWGSGGVATPGDEIDEGVRMYKAATLNTKVGSLLVVNSKGEVEVVTPAMVANDPPYFDGICLAAPGEGLAVPVCTQYGKTVTIEGARWVVGDLLYMGPTGEVTNSLTSLQTGGYWIMPVGRAVTTNSMIYAPQLPFNWGVVFNPQG